MYTRYRFKTECNIKIQATTLKKAEIDRTKTKFIGNYSFCPMNTIGCGLTSRVYKGKNHITSKF